LDFEELNTEVDFEQTEVMKQDVDKSEESFADGSSHIQ